MKTRGRIRGLVVLMHSPFVGPATLRPLAAALSRRGRRAVVPDLRRVGASSEPASEVIAAAMASAADEPSVWLVPHSNAGVYVPVVAAALGRRYCGAVFMDALLPASGSTRVASAEMRRMLDARTDRRGVLPRWSEWWPAGVMDELVPDPVRRRALVANQPRVSASYLAHRVPAPKHWQSRPACYVAFGDAYADELQRARAAHWATVRLEGLHLHAVVAPDEVAHAIVALMDGSPTGEAGRARG